MATAEIAELKRIFLTRLDTLAHILDVGARHLDLEAALQARKGRPPPGGIGGGRRWFSSGGSS